VGCPGVFAGYPIGVVEGIGRFPEGVLGDHGPRGEGRDVAVAVMMCMDVPLREALALAPSDFNID